MIRLYRAATSCSPNRVAREGVGQEGTVAIIQFPAITHEAGQYGYLVCPQISADNWHPFTIASAPCDAVTTLVVKDMGSGTWTRQLHECVQLYPDIVTPLCFCQFFVFSLIFLFQIHLQLRASGHTSRTLVGRGLWRHVQLVPSERDHPCRGWHRHNTHLVFTAPDVPYLRHS